MGFTRLPKGVHNIKKRLHSPASHPTLVQLFFVEEET